MTIYDIIIWYLINKKWQLQFSYESIIFRIYAFMRFTENDVELLNWMARTDRNSWSEWQEIRQASNEPLNDFSTIFRQGHFAANDWKRNDVSSIRHLIIASAASPLTSIASPVRVSMLLMTHASSKRLRLTVFMPVSRPVGCISYIA